MQLISSGMLDKVRQLGVEFHIPDDHRTLTKYQLLANIVKSIENTGMVRLDSKYNM